MGAKAKAKLAKKEEKEAKKDDAYQDLMNKGQSHFESNEFEAALESFGLAGERRPLNVYPPVMIEDVKLAMANYVPSEETAELEKPKELPKEERRDNTTQDERVKDAYQKELEKVKANTPPPPKFEEPKESEKPDLEKRDPEGIIIYEEEETPEAIADEYPDGITEETYKEGNKTIVKRVKVANGLATVYKKVVHSWGGVFYFKDGKSITVGAWEEETGK